ncbi:MAG: DMT family transporter [Isosphaeraceae bacterium]
MSIWLMLSLLAMICWGITGNTQKLSTRYISAQFSFLGFALAFVPIAIVAFAVCRGESAVGPWVLALGILGGVLNSLGALTSFAAFEAGAKSSVAVPIMYLYPLLTVLLARIFLHEEITAAHWAGILLAPVAAWLLSRE